MVALHGGLFQGPVQALHLAVGPRVRRFGQAVFHAVFPANTVETVPAGQALGRLGRELDPLVGQYCKHLIGQLVGDAAQKLGRDNVFGARVAFGKRYFTGAVNGPEELRLALLGLPFRKIDAQVVDGIALAFLFRRPWPVFAQRQAADAVVLKAAGQGRTRKAGNRNLQGVEPIVEGQREAARGGSERQRRWPLPPLSAPWRPVQDPFERPVAWNACATWRPFWG